MSENLSQQKRDIQEGDVVTYMGRDHEVFHIRGKWYGLIDLTRERPMATNQKGEVQGPVAHYAVTLDEIEPKRA